jgi:hypothetical protein
MTSKPVTLIRYQWLTGRVKKKEVHGNIIRQTRRGWVMRGDTAVPNHAAMRVLHPLSSPHNSQLLRVQYSQSQEAKDNLGQVHNTAERHVALYYRGARGCSEFRRFFALKGLYLSREP